MPLIDLRLQLSEHRFVPLKTISIRFRELASVVQLLVELDLGLNLPWRLVQQHLCVVFLPVLLLP